MSFAFPWEIRGESAEQENKMLKKKVKEQYQEIKNLEFTIDELKYKCMKIKDTKKRY